MVLGPGVLDLLVSGPNDLWVLSRNPYAGQLVARTQYYLSHYSAGSWTVETPPQYQFNFTDTSNYVYTQLSPLWAASANELWTVGYKAGAQGASRIHEPLVLRRTAMGWNAVDVPWPVAPDQITPLAVWGPGPNDVYVVAEDPAGLAMHSDGASWSPLALPAGMANLHLTGVTGTGANDVWIATRRGSVLHWDGSAWNLVPTPDGGTRGSARVFRVFAVGAEVYVSGEWANFAPAFFKYVAGSLTEQTIPGIGAVWSMWMSPDGILFVLGTDANFASNPRLAARDATGSWSTSAMRFPGLTIDISGTTSRDVWVGGVGDDDKAYVIHGH